MTVSERIISAPWGGQLVDVAVYGVRASREAGSTTSAQLERRSASAGAGGPAILAPMDAAVAHTPVAVGQPVAKGAPVLVLEAMKMEVVLAAPHDGIVEALHVGVGDAVKSGAVVAVVRPVNPESET